MKSEKFSAVSLFSGCGGSDLGLKMAGIRSIWSNDIDEFACSLFPSVVGHDSIHPGDITNYCKFPKADILVAKDIFGLDVGSLKGKMTH